MAIYRSKHYPESTFAHRYLDGLKGLEIGGAYHNAFGLETLNVDLTSSKDTESKRLEIAYCGEAMPVDIVAHGDRIPVPDKSYDFVISSHVIEHFFDPVGAMKEWRRIAQKYIFIVCPRRDALESDRALPITPLEELVRRHSGDLEHQSIDVERHQTRWTPQTFVQMCALFRFEVIEVQDPDDKVGNGFSVIIDTAPSLAKVARAAWRKQRILLSYRAAMLLSKLTKDSPGAT